MCLLSNRNNRFRESESYSRFLQPVTSVACFCKSPSFLEQPTWRAGGFVDDCRHFTWGGAELISRTYAAASRYFIVNSLSSRTIQESYILVFLVLSNLFHIKVLVISYIRRSSCKSLIRLLFSLLNCQLTIIHTALNITITIELRERY